MRPSRPRLLVRLRRRSWRLAVIEPPIDLQLGTDDLLDDLDPGLGRARGPW